MKNSEIHKGLPDSLIRNLIAYDFRQTFYMDFENKLVTERFDENDVWGYIIQDSKNQIKYFEKRLKITELRKGLTMVLEHHGWEEFDVSDITEKQSGETLWLNFIGTQKEYDYLLLQINGV
jgi:hypothetical protein